MWRNRTFVAFFRSRVVEKSQDVGQGFSLVYVEQVFIKCSIIGFSVGCLKSVDSSDEAAQTVGFSGFAALTLLGFISFDDSSSSCFEFS